MTERSRIVAAGAGRMGRGLAHVFAYAGHDVDLVDLKPRSDREHAEISAAVDGDLRRGLGALVDHGVISASDVDTIQTLHVDRFYLQTTQRD